MDLIDAEAGGLCHNNSHLNKDGTGDDVWLGIVSIYGIQLDKNYTLKSHKMLCIFMCGGRYGDQFGN
jgi:hypothetical protein